MSATQGTPSTLWSVMPPGLDTTTEGSLGFIIKTALSKMQTITLVRVVSVAAGAVGPVGSCSVQPLVNMVSGAGQGQEHGTIQGIPYLRLQGGSSAIIIDPSPGDTGICAFASRDISSVKANKAPSNPGSNRRFNWADGLYLGGVLNGTPTQYAWFENGNIHLHCPGTIFLEGNVVHTGTFNSNGHDVGSDHRHTASGGAGLGGPPQ